MGSRILVIEDEPEMQVILRDNLEYEGYQVISAETGEDGITLAIVQRPHLVLLDIVLPSMSGYEVCRKLRASGLRIPIIMISARNSEIDRVAGLEIGADDYVGKPFSVRELVARVRVQLRKTERVGRKPHEFAFGEIVVDLARYQVRRRSRLVQLSAREFDLLRYLIAHSGEVVTREQLLGDVWGYSNLAMSRTVDNFIAKLRHKLEPNPHNPRHVVTVHGGGYRFTE